MDETGLVAGAQGTDTQAQAQTQVAGNVAGANQGASAQVTTQRVFTQDELNAIVGDRVKTYKADILRLTDENSLTKKEKADLEAKFQDLECVDSLRKNKVNEDYLDFVKFEAGKLVKDGKNFNDALADYLKSHPQYVSEKDSNTSKSKGNADDKGGAKGNEAETQQQGIKGSSSGHGAGTGSADDTSDSYDAIMRKKGYIK